MDISKRLKTVAHAVTPGKRMADVGTDHGYVPIYLVKAGRCPGAIAMDINVGPLERAVQHIEEEGLSHIISTRLSDGMKELKQGEVDTVVIAGMGGDLMCRILTAREDLMEDGLEFVLQPQSEWFKVRHLLHDHGYAIRKEWFLKEDGKYYVIMKTEPGQQKFDEEWQYSYGAFLEEDCVSIYQEYLEKEKKKKVEISAGIVSQIKKEASLMEDQNTKNENNLLKRKQRVEELEGEIAQIDARLQAL
ncbi:MAG: class I SAM-dependent methyltransferase [Eubacteriales bacterium]|nr:class I SAM-dependent methyltransferase [Eubacteriales bacterium]